MTSFSIQAWEEIKQNYTKKINQLENKKLNLQCRVEALERILEERSDSPDKSNFPSFSPCGDRNIPSRSKKSRRDDDSICPCKSCPYKGKNGGASSCACICRRMSTLEETTDSPSSSSTCICNNKTQEEPPVMYNDSSFCVCKEPTKVPEKCTCIVIPPPLENTCNEKLDRLLELIERSAPAVLGPEKVKKDCNCNEVIDNVENAVKQRIMPVVDGMLADFCDCVDKVRRSLFQSKEDTESIYNPHSPNCICRQCLIDNQITYSSSCDCDPCKCQPCAADANSSSCPCGEFCAPKDADVPCGCVDVQPAVSPQQDRKRDTEQTIHPPECDCVDCICKPCILKEKSMVREAPGKTAEKPSGNGKERPIPASSDYDACKCDPCEDPDITKNNNQINAKCDCLECLCNPCHGPVKANTDASNHSQKNSTFCDCLKCLCDPCSIVNGKPRPASAPLPQTSATLHTPECDCVDCICKPCILKEKATARKAPGKTAEKPSGNGKERPRPASSDYDACKCDPCEDPDIIKNNNQINAKCDCLECLCNPCNGPVKANTAASNQPQKNSTFCDCLECLCDPCSIVNGKPRPASAPLPQTSAPLHSPECDCLKCVCQPCNDPKKQSSVVPGDEKFGDCDCGQCLCDPCKPPADFCDCVDNVRTLSQPKEDTESINNPHSPNCICRQCLIENKITYSSTCDCDPCKCQPCAVDANSSSCPCGEFCACQPCVFAPKGADLPCGCVDVQPGVSPQQDRKRDTEKTIHTPECDCIDCICKPCILKEKATAREAPGKTTEKPSGNGKERPRPASSDYDACKCDPCEDPDITKNNNQFNAMCDCLDCLCNPCNGPVKANTTASNQPQNYSTFCDCLECLCDPCSIVNGKPRPASAPLPQTSAPLHSPECDCLKCVCQPCNDPKKQSTVVPGDQKYGDCDCGQCICDPCKSPGNQKCDCDNCRCESCPFPMQVKHSVDCECLQCVCQPCDKKPSNVNAPKQEPTVPTLGLVPPPVPKKPPVIFEQSHRLSSFDRFLQSAKAAAARCIPSSLKPAPVIQPVVEPSPVPDRPSRNLSIGNSTCICSPCSHSKPRPKSEPAGYGGGRMVCDVSKISLKSDDITQMREIIALFEKQKKLKRNIEALERRKRF